MENNKTPVITVNGIKKEYRLGNINVKTLSREIGSFFARIRKKQDPNLEIGKEDKRGEKVLALNGIDLNVYKGERLGIIGKNGAMLRTIGTNARKELEELLEAGVFLELFVKIQEDWRNIERNLKQMGYTDM